jgi:hypothetical protein
LGRGDHVSARRAHAPARAMLTTDRKVTVRSWAAGDDSGMARVGLGQPRESRLGFKENPSMNQGRSGLHSGASG